MKTFILYDVNIDNIDSKYKFQFRSNIDTVNYSSNTNTTTIEDLVKKDEIVSYSYYDNSKKNTKCVCTLVNTINKPLPPKTDILCYWCKHSCKHSPIGCPIKYNNKPKKHYIVDGIFCSFNCCYAFIKDNSHNSLYETSAQLLHKMCNELYKKCDDEYIQINSAPNWRLLKSFGGHLSIEEFHNNFKTYSYRDIHNYITSLPNQLPVSWLYEEKVIF